MKIKYSKRILFVWIFKQDTLHHQIVGMFDLCSQIKLTILFQYHVLIYSCHLFYRTWWPTLQYRLWIRGFFSMRWTSQSACVSLFGNHIISTSKIRKINYLMIRNQHSWWKYIHKMHHRSVCIQYMTFLDWNWSIWILINMRYFRFWHMELW